jgi:hypothetical protein
MFLLRRPTDQQIYAQLTKREPMTFSYPQVGATRSKPPAGFRINHVRGLIGKGAAAQARAANALLSWQLLGVAGLEVFPKNPEMQPQTNVALLSQHLGIWSLDFCRVIYVLEEQSETAAPSSARVSAMARCPDTRSAERRSFPWSGMRGRKRSGTTFSRFRDRRTGWFKWRHRLRERLSEDLRARRLKKPCT